MSLINSQQGVEPILSQVLVDKSVKVYNNHYYLDYLGGQALLLDKSSNMQKNIDSDLVIICNGSSSYDLFQKSHLHNQNGYMLVNEYLQST